MEVPKDQQRLFVWLYVLGSVMVMLGFAAQFSSSIADFGIIFILAGCFYIIIADIHEAMVGFAVRNDLQCSKMGRLDVVGSALRLSGQSLYFIAALSVTDGKVTLVWFGLIGSILNCIGSFIYGFRRFQDAPNELPAAEKVQEVALE